MRHMVRKGPHANCIEQNVHFDAAAAGAPVAAARPSQGLQGCRRMPPALPCSLPLGAERLHGTYLAR